MENVNSFGILYVYLPLNKITDGGKMIRIEAGDTGYADDAALAEQFSKWVAEAVAELRQLVDGLPSGAVRADDSVERIFSLTHNMKGMGASFNYTLLTEAGQALCLYLKSREDNDAVSKRILHAYIRTFEVVIDNGITGSGDEKGKALLGRLAAIVSEESAAGG